jgi:hypothetical protein
LISTRPVPPDLLYPKAINGGVLIAIHLKDDRAGRKAGNVLLEMKRLPLYGWYPCKHELDARESAAILGIALATFYRISRELESRRKIRGLVFFDTFTLFDKDMRCIDDLAERVAASKGRRPGAHAEHCTIRNHRGVCPHKDFCTDDAKHRGACERRKAGDDRRRRRRKPASAGWSRSPRRHRNAGSACAELASPGPSIELTRPRQTVTEAVINESTTDLGARASMYAEQQADIDAERCAGMFVSAGSEVP